MLYFSISFEKYSKIFARNTHFRQLIQQHDPERDLYLISVSQSVLEMTKMK